MILPKRTAPIGRKPLTPYQILLSESEINALEEVAERIGKSAKSFGGRALAAALRLDADEKPTKAPSRID